MWLLTSGPTREHLDDVRFLSNASSGRMGHEIARAARDRGHAVTLIQGPVALPEPGGVRVIHVVSAAEMLEAGLEVLRESEAEIGVLMGVAAVCDWRPRERVRGKPKKSEDARTLELVPNPDVLATLAAQRRAGLHVGFALQAFADESETAAFERAIGTARQKIERKGLDAIVLNEVAAMESLQSRAWFLERGSDRVDALGGTLADRGLSKRELAGHLVERCERLLRSRRDSRADRDPRD